jgi:hypothetical protein
MAAAGERVQCPACESFSAAVAKAVEDGAACPSCALPANAFPLVAEARSRSYRPHIIDALIEYARLAESLDRQRGELLTDLRQAQRAAERAEERVESVRSEIEQMRGAQAASRAKYQRQIDALTWRLDRIREGVTGPLNGPLPAHLREDART